MEKIDIGIITAVDHEFDAVNEVLGLELIFDYQFRRHISKGTVNNYNIISACCDEKGSVQSALTTYDLAINFNPNWIVLLGMCGGDQNKVLIGDVVFATEIWAYEYEKIEGRKIKHKPRVYRVDNELSTNVHHVIKGLKKVICACGSKVIASKEYRGEHLDPKHADICFIEMESEGVAAAAKRRRLPFMVIKGIADNANKKTKGRRKSFEEEKEELLRQKEVTKNAARKFSDLLASDYFRDVVPPKSQKETFPAMALDHNRPDECLFVSDCLKAQCFDVMGKELPVNLFPPDLWERWPSPFFQDHSEALHLVEICQNYEGDEEDISRKNISEINEDMEKALMNPAIDEKTSRKIRQWQEEINKGQTPYPRVIDYEINYNKKGRQESKFTIHVAPSIYGFTLLREMGAELSSVKKLFGEKSMSSLAVKMACISEDKYGNKFIEVQKRSEKNGTYCGAWAVGAAGYVHPVTHKDPDNDKRLSPWFAAANEVSEELNIRERDLPNRENYDFFGLVRNDLSGSFDLFGMCKVSTNLFNTNRSIVSDKVESYDRLPAVPEALARAVKQKQYWVPTSILVMMFCLRHIGYTRERIEASFSEIIACLKFNP